MKKAKLDSAMTGGEAHAATTGSHDGVTESGKQHPEVLGEHTTIGFFRRNASLWTGTIPALNEGLLPPYILIVGDRRRVVSVASFMDNVSMLHAICGVGDMPGGRVHLAVGTYKGTPIAVVESEMGCPATEIIAKEVLAENASSRKYVVGQKTFVADSKYIIRIGSCGAINAPGTDLFEIRPFDLLVATHQAGLSGACIQVYSGKMNLLDPECAKRAWHNMKAHGWRESAESKLPLLDADSSVSAELVKQCEAEIKNAKSEARPFACGNFSKDSLYLEGAPEDFIAARKTDGVGSTEMEFSALLRVSQEYSAHGFPVKAGMVCFALGTIPGVGFHVDHVREAQSRDISALAALGTLHQVSAQHIQ